MRRGKAPSWLWRMTGCKKGYVLALTLAQGVMSALGVSYALAFRDFVDSAVGQETAGFRRYAAIILAIVISRLVVSAIIRWLNELAKADLENALKKRLFDNILRKDYATVSATNPAEWLNRLTGDTAIVAGGAVDILPGLFGMLVRLVTALAMLVAMDRWLACLLIPGGIILLALTLAFREVLKRLHKDIQESDGRLRALLQERLSSLMALKAFVSERKSVEDAAVAMERHKEARLRRNRFSNAANVGFGLAMQGMYLVGVVYCAHGIMVRRVTYGTLTAVMQLIGQVRVPLANVSGYLPRWYAMTASAERLMEVEGYPDEGEPLSRSEISDLYGRMEAIALRDASFVY